ncbi:MAG: molybdate ABC transporter permease subunit [Pseudomonadota bacterium]
MAAVRVTLALAGATTVSALLVAVPLAWWLAHTTVWWRDAIAALIALPLVLPPTVLGFYMLTLLGPDGPLAPLLALSERTSFAFSFDGLVIASTVSSLPFAVHPLRNAFAATGRGPLEAAATLGAGPWDAFFRVAMPLALPGVITAAVLTFAHTMGEFGVVLMIGGSLSGETKVLSILIYESVETLQFARVHALSLAMVVFAFAVIALTMWSQSAMTARSRRA